MADDRQQHRDRAVGVIDKAVVEDEVNLVDDTAGVLFLPMEQDMDTMREILDELDDDRGGSLVAELSSQLSKQGY